MTFTIEDSGDADPPCEPPKRRRLALHNGRAVSALVWGFSMADADLAAAEASDAARCRDWQLVEVLRIVGGKASDATSQVADFRVLRRFRDYDRAYVLFASSPSPSLDNPAAYRALAGMIARMR